MTSISLTHRTSPDLFPRALAAVAAFFDAIGEGRRIAQRYEQLSRLSDTALAARGLTRMEVPRAAVLGR